MNIQLLVAAHRASRMPEDPMYLPIQVGCAGTDLDLGFRRDDEGDNISEKNPTFCELTAVYWAYKNLDADYIGLSHYRRHFRGKSGRDKWACVLTGQEARKLLQDTDVLVPRRRRYYIETIYSLYVHAHPAQGLDQALELVRQQGPQYSRAADTVMNRTWYHNYNMFLMKADIFRDYCGWLFPILFTLEAQLDISDYSDYDRRVFGFVGERMLDIYLEANGIPWREIPVMFMEKQNWLKKGGNFLKRKFLKKESH